MEVQQASDRFWTTRARGDAAALAALFTDDGMFMVPGLPDASGRKAVRELLEQRFAGGRTFDLVVHRREIEVTGDSANELAWYSESHQAQGQTMRMDGRYLLVWQRGGDGAWRVHRYLYNFSGATPVDAPSE
jgi:uncharacterized protein (TIGR02246 family)